VVTGISFTGVLSIANQQQRRRGRLGLLGRDSATVTISGGGGTGATATAVVTNGVVSAIMRQQSRHGLHLDTDGRDRPRPPAVTPRRSRPMAVATLASAGTGYTSAPTITIAAPRRVDPPDPLCVGQHRRLPLS